MKWEQGIPLRLFSTERFWLALDRSFWPIRGWDRRYQKWKYLGSFQVTDTEASNIAHKFYGHGAPLLRTFSSYRRHCTITWACFWHCLSQVSLRSQTIADRRSQTASHRCREVTGSNPVEVLKVFQVSLPNCIYINCVPNGQLRSCDHMETKVLRSAIEICPIIWLIQGHVS